VVTYELSSGRKRLTVLHANLSGEQNSRYDDHNAPAFLVRPDGCILAVYARHGAENHFYYRISAEAGNPAAWQTERTFTPSASSQITYSNLIWLAAENSGKGRIYDFFRGLDGRNKPSYAWSDDLGETWKTGGVFIDVPTSFPHRPYVKYACNGVDTVHMFYSDGHPHEFNSNSNYHIYYKGGMLYKSDGSRIRGLKQGLGAPDEGTRIFSGDAANIAWTSDIRLDRSGRPYVAYSVRKVQAGASAYAAGEDHRYRYARWIGTRWIDHEIAYAGSCLYSSELDYTGNITLDPGDPDTVYISTNAEPKSGAPLISRADGKRHYEIFKGATMNGGASWSWTPVTADSSADNLRPIVPDGSGDTAVLLWLRGTYRAYTDYSLAVVGIITRRQQAATGR
jgi:BNR repeat-containing family member